jgi:hypothetical protein
MDAADFFMLRYEPLHTQLTERLFDNLTEPLFRARPHRQNSIAWVLWHVARAEDMAVNAFAAKRPELIEIWSKRIGWNARDVGTSMPSDEVSKLSTEVDMTGLREYWDAVGRCTTDYVKAHGSTGWGDPLDEALVQRIVHEEGDFRPDAAWVQPVYQGRCRGWLFAHFVLTHNYGHFYEAGVIRGLLGMPGR